MISRRRRRSRTRSRSARRRVRTTRGFAGTDGSLPVFPNANPSRALLDSLVPDRPAYVRAADGHSAWVNSRALALAHVTARTRNPPDGRIERDAAGNPSGTLREGAADLVAALLPKTTAEERVEGLERAVALRELARHRRRCRRRAPTATSSSPTTRSTSAARCNARVVASIYVDPAAGTSQIPRMERLRTQFDGTRLRVRGAKIFADGVIESHTSALLEPYTGTHDRGPANLTPGRLRFARDRARQGGLPDPRARDRRPRRAHGARCDRGRAARERRARCARPHRAPRDDRHARPPSLQVARRVRELPGALGLSRQLHQGSHRARARPRALEPPLSARERRRRRRNDRGRQRLGRVVAQSTRGDTGRGDAVRSRRHYGLCIRGSRRSACRSTA